jgi:XapX domain-containing protein
MATLTGLAVGVLFSFLKLPLPAPPTLAGVMGIVGMFVGFVIMNHIF